MTKKICMLYTQTNGLHDTCDNVSKKNLYAFARLVVINYEIGYRSNNTFISEKKVRKIVKPNCMFINDNSIAFHGITNEIANNEGEDIINILNGFINDLEKGCVIVSHNVEFHINTLLAEYVRYNIKINLNNYIIIDTISFYHTLSFPKLNILYKYLFPDNNENIDNLTKIKNCFLKLYNDFENSIK